MRSDIMPSRLDDDEILKDIKYIIDLTSDTTYKNYKALGKHSDSTITAHFGNWNNALARLNITPKHKRLITKQEIVEDVIKVFNETNNTNRENYLKYGKFSRAPIKRLFGGWNNLLKELGVDINMHKQGQYTKEDILFDYGELCIKYDKILTATEYRKLGKYSQPIIDNVFGSFSLMKKELGLKYDVCIVTNEELIEDLKKLYNQYGFLTTALIDDLALCSFATILSRIGNIREVHKIIGVPYKCDSNMSCFSRLVLEQAKSILGCDYITEHDFDWLINPKTNKKMFLDIYYPHLNLAIEADGEQHFHYSPLFHESYEDFQEYQYRDKVKNELLQQHNIKLIRVPYNLKANQIKELIKTESQSLIR